MSKKIIVFDIGGTLMEYKNMPLSWIDYYEKGFIEIAKAINYSATHKDIEKSVAVMKELNPRINYREIEYTPEFIFGKALEHWNIDIKINLIIEPFFNAMKLRPEIYSYSIPLLKNLKSKGYTIAALTDNPQGMPDSFFQKGIYELMDFFDCYISSQSCGYRKPNTYGLKLIAEKYNIPIESLIFIGDEEKDKQTAINAGCKFYYADKINQEIFNA